MIAPAPEGSGGAVAELRTFRAPEDAPRLDVLVASQLELSRNAAATLIADGRVTVGGRREKASYRATDGEEVRVDVPPPRGREVVAEQIPLTVVFEDEHLLVVDKAAGMVVHPAPGNWTGTLANALRGRGMSLPESEGREGGREGIVHRLDRDTSGLLIVARTDRSHRLLSAALQARRIVRRYAVLCRGHLAEDRLTVERPIARHPRDRTRMAIVSSGRPARTDFARLARLDSGDLLRAHLHTGRTHQIRVHLASIGHPVAGDATYGGGGGPGASAGRGGGGRHFLHAAWLQFRHPITGAEMDLRSPLPDDLVRSLREAAGEYATVIPDDPLEHFGFYRLHL
jgi:23S rRNA pseudouridine1911/1915/1917 synthase